MSSPSFSMIWAEVVGFGKCQIIFKIANSPSGKRFIELFIVFIYFLKAISNFILHMSNKKVNHYVKKEREISAKRLPLPPLHGLAATV